MHRTSTTAALTALLAIALGAGCSSSSDEQAGTAFPDAPLTTVTSSGGKLSVAAFTSPAQPPARGMLVVKLAFTEVAGGKPVDGLTLEMAPDMPSMGHGTPTIPRISGKGGGVYLAEDVNLFMAGRWDLRITVSGASSDVVVVPVDVR
jgi:hypothetical protein